MSIRKRLIIHLTLVTVVLTGGGAWLSYVDVRHETQELFDAQLARSARLILSLIQADSGQIDFSSIQNFLNQNQLKPPEQASTEALFSEEDEEFGDGHIYETKLGFQIWHRSGNLLLKSSNLPVSEISSQTNGFSHYQYSGNDWRVFALTSMDGRYRCITAERVDVRNDLIGDIFSDLLILFVVLVLVLAITMWFAISQGLSSLQNLTAQIQSRGAEKLDSISQNNNPEEIKTITGALNQLLSKLKQALAREKRITSDAAHELRTPLAAVKLHAELASRADNAGDRKNAIKHVMLGIDRTTHLVNQLLALARLEPESFDKNLRPHNLSKLLIEETALLAPLAQEKSIDLSLDDSGDIEAQFDDTAIRLLIRNLLNNAIAYTQTGGIIKIKLIATESEVGLIVEDNGPGIPVAEREQVLQRFYRLKNHDTTGCGIGLSIVSRVVELHHGSLSLDDAENGSGLCVKVSFPFVKQSIERDLAD